MSAHIIAARRSPVMTAGGAFARLDLHHLARPVIAACLADAGVEPGEVEELICANALAAGGNPARVLALAAGLSERVAGLTIDRQCAGGLDAIRLGAALITAGAADLVLAGGVESASRRPIRMRTDPGGGPPVAYDAPPFTPWPERDPDMHEAAATLALRLGISRVEQDAFAVASHARAMAAVLPEIVPVAGHARDGFTRQLTPALAARARPVHGTITAANAAVSADAAAFVLLASARIASRAPRALRILASATLGAATEDPGLAPIPAIARIWSPSDALAQAEIMEAYAVQAIACIRGAGIDPAIVNPGGGALARGHPIGASGAILATRLFHDLQSGRGLAAIAAAGGIGSALLIGA
ncbi:thiolase family protein [Szabonella alba]|uniref:Thiolase family protein n=1 Tax=Szabonella alba TaxID=2804194 RepID=A0A8K0VGB0_9RHOB|nr:thiolase family protein [Szabonella alba]MBL4918852.1 thiolase family protein [Szabonella alba]